MISPEAQLAYLAVDGDYPRTDSATTVSITDTQAIDIAGKTLLTADVVFDVRATAVGSRGEAPFSTRCHLHALAELDADQIVAVDVYAFATEA